MKVAVLTMCRDRLDYTKACFTSLLKNAGVQFDHFVLDQGSDDETVEWLLTEYKPFDLSAASHNHGWPRGMNLLLDQALQGDYDVIVSWDNDCEATMPDTLRILCETCLEGNAILSPRVHGLRNPPGVGDNWRIGDQIIDEAGALGAICRAHPATVFTEHGFRMDETWPVWSGDEAAICRFWRGKGGNCGYMRSLIVNHYLGTLGQVEDIEWYFRRREREGGPFL